MNKPIKGVMPATPTKKKPDNEIKSEITNNSLKPIKKNKSGTNTIKLSDQSEGKIFKVPSKDEIDYITDVIVEKLMKVFVSKSEVKEVVEKILQEMVATKSDVSKK